MSNRRPRDDVDDVAGTIIICVTFFCLDIGACAALENETVRIYTK